MNLSSCHATLCCVLLAAAAAGACRRDAPEPGAVETGIRLIWEPESRCENEAVNAFVTRAVGHCVDGNYEEYRLLWRYDHRPTSRRHFERLWSLVDTVEVKRLQPLRFQLPDGSLDDRELYVFHAFITLRPEAREAASERLRDRDLILLIVPEDGAWRLAPAPSEVKAAVLGPTDSGRSGDDGAVAEGGD